MVGKPPVASSGPIRTSFGNSSRPGYVTAARKSNSKGRPTPSVGVGLSGGGIRSGTFALGLFQGLAKGAAGSRRPTGLLRHIDYLSTVSGGGYFGSFFGRLLTRDYVKKPEDVERILQGKTQPEVLRFLRENGRYMAPNGGGDSLLLGAVLFRNWASIQLVLGLFVLAIFLGLQCLRAGLELGQRAARFHASGGRAHLVEPAAMASGGELPPVRSAVRLGLLARRAGAPGIRERREWQNLERRPGDLFGPSVRRAPSRVRRGGLAHHPEGNPEIRFLWAGLARRQC